MCSTDDKSVQKLVVTNHCGHIINTLKTFCTDGILTNVTFVTGTTKVCAHLPIIQCFSSHILDCLCDEVYSVYISDTKIDSHSLKLVIDYFYTGVVVAPNELKSQFDKCAKFFDINFVAARKDVKQEGIYYTLPNYPETILQELWDSRIDPSKCDVIFVTSGYVQLQAHSCILGACSSYLLHIFQEHRKEKQKPFLFVLPNVTEDDLQIVIEFCYKGFVVISNENSRSVYKTAKLLGVENLCDKLSSAFPYVLEVMQKVVNSREQSRIRTSFGACEESGIVRNPLQDLFYSLLQCGNLVDVSIYVENSKLEAHLLILSIFSTLFRNITSKLKDKLSHTIVLISGLTIQHIQAFIDYIYRGEAEFPGSVSDFCKFMSEWLDFDLLPVCEKNSITMQYDNTDSDTVNETSSSENITNIYSTEKTICSENEDTAEGKASPPDTRPVSEEEEEEEDDEEILDNFNEYQNNLGLVCHSCNETFPNRQQFKQHLKIHPDAKMMKCKYCGKGFEKPSQMRLHIRIHTGSKPFQCDVCGMRFAAKSSLTKHRKTHTKDKSVLYACDVCNKSFSRKEYVTEHLRTHTGSKPYECSICHKAFVGRTGLNHHKKIHTDNNSRKSTVCEICGKNFTRHALWTHMKSHNKTHRCELCGNLFSTKTALKIHIAGSHLGHMSHQCDICGKGFMQKNHLLRHMDTHIREGQDEDKFSCDSCEKKYKTEEKLDSHRIREHSKPGERPYSCNICNKKFSGRSTVIYHRRTHTGEQPHECTTCGKTFTRPDALRQHTRSHTNERKFRCSVCNKKCSSRDTLNKHLKSHKGTEDKGDTTTADNVPPDECEKVCSLDRDQCSHSTLHTSSRPHRCNICRKSFRYRDSLVKHTQIHSSVSLQLPGANELPSLFSFHMCEQSYTQECDEETQKNTSFCTVTELLNHNEAQELSVSSAAVTNSSLVSELKNTASGSVATRRPFSITIDGNLCCNSDVLLPTDDSIVALVPALSQEVSDPIAKAPHNDKDQSTAITEQTPAVPTTDRDNVPQSEPCFSTILSKSFELQAI
ncbi:uncharacterized protein LOC126279123 isoform X1 [Schistocerca gregaria]|uniref:uncharacterized protein LOC126279123 isoform X1 n=1 Tax=Schistocerca gregaria TaxID=7010 RepID=UPI00211EB924|nr:uncharacterized protein LOC126279123 isoform X1 [Schistocerca gregaria]